MQFDDTRNEHHNIDQRQCRSEQSKSAKNVDDIHKAEPSIIYLVVEHKGLHFVLFLVELVKGFEVVDCKFNL